MMLNANKVNSIAILKSPSINLSMKGEFQLLPFISKSCYDNMQCITK